jgi:hypothetical protein
VSPQQSDVHSPPSQHEAQSSPQQALQSTAQQAHAQHAAASVETGVETLTPVMRNTRVKM